jgi:predicted membrane channel-forming protein YqfA (hemolysin III family)
MFALNNPYILSILIGLVAVGIFYFDQKQKNIEQSRIEYIKIFILVTGSILTFNYFVNNYNITQIQIVEKAPLIGSGMYSNLKIKEGPPDF